MTRERKFVSTGQVWQELADRIMTLLAGGDFTNAYAVFVELQKASAPWLLAIASRKGPAGQAEDLVADTHLALFRHFQAGKPVRKVKALLGTIIRSRAVDALRQRASAPVVQELDDVQFARGRAETPDPGALASLIEVEDRVAREVVLNSLLEALPIPEREALLARHLEGLSVVEASQKLGKSDDQVKKLCQSALKRVRSLIKERGLQDVL